MTENTPQFLLIHTGVDQDAWAVVDAQSGALLASGTLRACRSWIVDRLVVLVP